MTTTLLSNLGTEPYTFQKLSEYIRLCERGQADAIHASRYFRRAVRDANPDTLADTLALWLCGNTRKRS